MPDQPIRALPDAVPLSDGDFFAVDQAAPPTAKATLGQVRDAVARFGPSANAVSDVEVLALTVPSYATGPGAWPQGGVENVIDLAFVLEASAELTVLADLFIVATDSWPGAWGISLSLAIDGGGVVGNATITKFGAALNEVFETHKAWHVPTTSAGLHNLKLQGIFNTAADPGATIRTLYAVQETGVIILPTPTQRVLTVLALAAVERRVTEAGDYRITEAGDYRILE